ncbi:MAG: Ferrochelatase, protoheme ferro-lyase (EC [uncultured Campylobacterales bacterium]|uniref:Ferrochelatase n=1 Tax=uncultured Campylobacterales bacterium TaxID=352960 RepID=A0A6S6S272_9BACT|nr:MAG: Ferrochelatase, protoheme ferro-lyase (EC [uncultured Campylobacterales bacterium]
MKSKKAILLLNMGGPNNIDEVKVFLNNMFNDKAIIGAPKPIRKMIAFLITTLRLKEAKSNYKKLGGKSPIVAYTKNLVKKLAGELDEDVYYVMRYTPPFADDVLKDIKDYDKFYLIPMYPHYSSTTTASSLDHIYKSAKKFGIDRSKFVSLDKYYNNKVYNNSIISRIKESLADKNANDYELIFSAHGLPKSIIDKGDVYQNHIKQNVLTLRKMLLANSINFNNTHIAYQSRLGPVEWIKPYLDDKLKEISKNTKSKKKVLIYPIAFTIDNSETEFELDVEYKEIADELKLEDYQVIKAPNEMMSDSIKDLYQKM